ncbi:ABC transporter permease [Candidatus Methylacidiphilum infernorum]|uniref:ABC-type multidrug transport system, permease component n=1 Tax=Methylacidiphilum infernorum (isolate V4) TaxID=481448 RepID=B3DW65_METI4|nr:ABC transporter permease [Candidatus Methylacidiphilum infernorum]ACD83568.1 ABC-type multidrug transport system, permease component [Methylacidiphilum infernorum V4]
MKKEPFLTGRLFGFIHKEWIEILRDPSSFGIAFILPSILLFLFGYGISLDAVHLPIAVVVENPTGLTSSFESSLKNSLYFSPRSYATIQEAEVDFQRGRLLAIVWLRGNWNREALAFGLGNIETIVNGTDANTARLIEGYLLGVWSTWLKREKIDQNRQGAIPVSQEIRVWFNPALLTKYYLVPGIIVVNMTVVGALLTALVVAREWERGTMEALLATPLTKREHFMGKLLPYFTLGMGGMFFSFLLAVFLFKVPFRGSFFVLLVASVFFLLAVMGIGVLISTLSRNSFVASMVSIVTSFLPAFMLSGFIFDIHSMPEPIQFLTLLFPARYFVAILQTLFLAGNAWNVIGWNLAVLAFFGLMINGITYSLWKTRID